jgi:hypothetical protein
MKKTIKIGDKTFSSNAECERYTRSLITEMGITKSVKQNNMNTFKYLLNLGERHHNYEEKFERFIDFEIRVDIMNKKGLALFIVNNDRTITEISWKKCITGKTTPIRDLFISSLRESIYPQISHYRENTDLSYCRICDCSLIDKLIHIDHYEPQFAELINNFLEIHNGLVIPTKYDKNKITYHTKFKEQDEWIGDKFAKYHLEHATLRVLCESCNIKRPKAELRDKRL